MYNSVWLRVTHIRLQNIYDFVYNVHNIIGEKTMNISTSQPTFIHSVMYAVASEQLQDEINKELEDDDNDNDNDNESNN